MMPWLMKRNVVSCKYFVPSKPNLKRWLPFTQLAESCNWKLLEARACGPWKVLPRRSPRSSRKMNGGPAKVGLATKLAVKPISCGVVAFFGAKLGCTLRAQPARNVLTNVGENV